MVVWLIIADKLFSIVIITHNRREDLEENISRLSDQQYEPVEIVVVDNSSTDGTKEMMRQKAKRQESLRYFRNEDNAGVGGGRNIGINEARGSIIICIDDDAMIDDDRAVNKIVEKFESSPEVGVLSFKSINYYSDEIDSKEFPHRDNSKNKDEEFETNYFIGVGHAIRKEVYKEVGVYSPKFFYGFEELDLSFRVMDAGYKIFYFPEVTVFHKKAPPLETRNSETWQNLLKNRIRVSIRNLPLRYVLGSLVIWSGFVFVKTKLNLFVLGGAYCAILADMKELIDERNVIDKETIRKVKSLQGRLLF